MPVPIFIVAIVIRAHPALDAGPLHTQLGRDQRFRDQSMTARITQRGKSAMQSGRAGAGDWLLEFDRGDRKGHDPLTGWISSDDTSAQVRLTFPTLDAAQAYATSVGLTPEVRTDNLRTLKLQAYADNFR